MEPSYRAAPPGSPSGEQCIEGGDDAYKKRDFERAIGFFNKAAQKLRPDASLYLKRARTWVNLDHYHLALKEIQYVIQRDAQIAEVRRTRKIGREQTRPLLFQSFDL